MPPIAYEVADQVRRLERQIDGYCATIARQEREISKLREQVAYLRIAWRCCSLSAKRRKEIIQEAKAKVTS